MENIIIATIKYENLNNAESLKEKFHEDFNIHIIDSKEKLSLRLLDDLKPKYVFFPHWSWIIPSEIYSKYNCIIFHTSDLPYGRGGSPIQNQIVRKIYGSYVCAVECVKEIDGGRIYAKKPVSLELGNADEILATISGIIFNELIPEILLLTPTPIPQSGEPIVFRRRKPDDSNIVGSDISSISDFFDFVRMLDGEGYPNAFIEVNGLKIDFSNIAKRNGFLEGTVKVYEK